MFAKAHIGDRKRAVDCVVVTLGTLCIRKRALSCHLQMHRRAFIMKLMSSQARSHYDNRNEISTLHFLHIKHQLLRRLKRQLHGPEVFAKCFCILAAGVQW